MAKLKEVISILITASALFAVVSGLSAMLQPEPEMPTGISPATPITTASSDDHVKQGASLFGQNCAMCHGQDARGDEGPTLYGLTKSDAQISKTLKEGIKGEVPNFGRKFDDADVQALIAFIRTLKG